MCFINKYKHKLNIPYLSCYQTLSQQFIEENKDNLIWQYIWGKQNISEEFIRKNIDKIDWHYISKRKLSKTFVKDYMTELNWIEVLLHNNYDNEFIKENKNCIIKFSEKYYNWYLWDEIAFDYVLSHQFKEIYNHKLPTNKKRKINHI